MSSQNQREEQQLKHTKESLFENIQASSILL